MQCKQKIAIRFLMILLIFPAITIISLASQAYNSIKDIRIHYELDIERVEQRRWDMIENIIDENISKAKIQSNWVKFQIVERIGYEYNNMETLYTDIRSHNNSAVYRIFSKSINNVYLNNNSEDNRVYIANRDGVIADKGIQSSAKQSRDWNSEINAKFNTDLATKAVSMILTKNNQLIYWDVHNDEHDNSECDSKEIYNPSMKALETIYKEAGIDGLRTYNILVPAYITNDGDIFGTPDVDLHGIRNNNEKIIVIQEFNIYDAVNIHKDDLIKYQLLINEYERECKKSISQCITMFVFLSIISFISFLAILIGANIFVNWGGEDVTRGCNKG